jgi:hypothetical protein
MRGDKKQKGQCKPGGFIPIPREKKGQPRRASKDTSAGHKQQKKTEAQAGKVPEPKKKGKQGHLWSRTNSYLKRKRILTGQSLRQHRRHTG